MERKEYNSLNEAALQVQLDEAGPIGGPKVKRTVNQQQQGVISKHKKNLSTTQANLDLSGVPANAPIRQKVRDTAASRMSTAASRMRLNAGTWDELDIPDMVLEYFDGYFGDNLTEDTSDEDIMDAVYDLIDLAEAVCDAVGLDESTAARKAETRKKGKYKYGTGPKPYSGSPEGAGASEEDKVYRARAEKGQGEMTGKGGRRVTQDTLRGGTLHNRKQGVTKNEYEALKKRFGDQIK